MEQINDAISLMEGLDNQTSISQHIISNLESFLATPLTPLASSWDNLAGDYVSNGVGNGMFYGVLTWAGLHSLYDKITNIALRRSPWRYRTCELTEAFWYIIVHTLLLFISLWMVDPGYVFDILHMDVLSFSWRILLHSVKIVPKKVLLVFVACSTFQIYSALQSILNDKSRSAFNKSLTAAAFIAMYCFRKIELLLMTNASFCIYRAVSELFKIYNLMTVPPVLRPKVIRSRTKSSQVSENREQLQTLYNTVKGALILKKSLRRHKERKKAEKLQNEEQSEAEMSDFSNRLLSDVSSTTNLPLTTETLPLVESQETIDSSLQEC